MKKIIITHLAATLLMTSLSVPALAQGSLSDTSRVNFRVSEDLQNCIYTDAELSSSKAIRACSKAYKNAVPRKDVRSYILMRRGLFQLSEGRFEKASRDFTRVAKLDNQTEFAALGQGYAALMQKDYQMAAQYFNDCGTNHKAAPIAMYGLAMSKELSGDLEGAVKAYEAAALLHPEWQAPRAELKRVKALT